MPTALFRIVGELRTASNCSLFVIIFPGMVYKSVRFLVIFPVAPTITGTTLAFFSFQDLFTSFLRSWYLVFCISVSLNPKSLVLPHQLAMPSSLFLYLSMISGCNALFSMFTLDGIIRSYVSGRYFHVFSDYFWFMLPQIFWNWDITVLCRCASGLHYKLCCVIVCTAVLT